MAARVPACVVIDFETYAIEQRPEYPPSPVGVAIQWPGRKPRYYAFAHASNNNCTYENALLALEEAYHSGLPLLAHNMKFDMEVAEEYFGVPRLPWAQYHDTLPLLFLLNPRLPSFQLKSNAETMLGEPPTERDAVCDWLLQHQPVAGVRITKSTYMKYMPWVPGDIAGHYACGDTTRTRGLFALVYPQVKEQGMLSAYDRERRLLPHLLEMERVGLSVHWQRLQRDITAYQQANQRLDAWLRKKLKVGESCNLDSDQQLTEALVQAGLADEVLLGMTRTGKLRADKGALAQAVSNVQVLHALLYRTQLGTCLSTFMQPWLATATSGAGGRIFTQWNSTRTPSGERSIGTRTGRMSSTPNFQNVPKTFAPLWRSEAKGLPTMPIELPPLPLVRGYIKPHEGHALLVRDYSQQELRILAHYEEGVLQQAYLDNPWMDMHAFAQEMINTALHRHYERKPIKNTGFGLIYGMGIGKLAMKAECTVDEARQIKDAYLRHVAPGIKTLYDDMRWRARNNLPIKTWGGRLYYVEPPEIVNGQIRTYDYKLVNVLIQGSAADDTKEAMVRYHEMRTSPEWQMYLTVHDELVVSAPKREMHEAMKCLRTAMESVEFDVPMLSEGTYSFDDWVHLHEYDKMGEVRCAA